MIRPVVMLFTLALTGNLAHAGDVRISKATYGHDSSSEQGFGLLGGATVGAAVGGPAGAVAGAAFGALVGDGWAAKKRVNHLQVDLVNSRRELAALQQETADLRRQYELALRQDRNQAQFMPANLETGAVGNCCDNTVMSVYFRTGSSNVENHDHELISGFANLSRHMADPMVEITGYADRSGDATANLQLSRDRTEAVRRMLADQGIKNTAITTVAYGESRPLSETQNIEADFFDRRVVIRLRDASQIMLSSNGDDAR
mgnify:CR=1 FL=1